MTADTPRPGESALSILSLDDAKADLEVYFNDDDALITRLIGASVSWVESYLSVPLVQRRSQWCVQNFDLVGLKAPINWLSRSIARVISIQHWTPDGDFVLDPDNTIMAANLGRIRYDELGTSIYPPAAGWPNRLTGAPVFIRTVDQDKLGSDPGRNYAPDPAVVAGVGSVLRTLYNGATMTNPNAAFKNVLGPLRNFSSAVPDLDLSGTLQYVDLRPEDPE